MKGSNALVLGVTFKENCPDTRNSKVIDIVRELSQFGLQVDVYDPHADPVGVKEDYDIELIDTISKKYDSIVLAVAHKEFLKIEFMDLLKSSGVLFDTKAFIDRKIISGRL